MGNRKVNLENIWYRECYSKVIRILNEHRILTSSDVGRLNKEDQTLSNRKLKELLRLGLVQTDNKNYRYNKKPYSLTTKGFIYAKHLVEINILQKKIEKLMSDI